MAIDGLKEVQEAVMRIEGGLSTYEKELALMGDDYQEIFRQQLRESQSDRQRSSPPHLDKGHVSAADPTDNGRKRRCVVIYRILPPWHLMNRFYWNPPMRGFSLRAG